MIRSSARSIPWELVVTLLLVVGCDGGSVSNDGPGPDARVDVGDVGGDASKGGSDAPPVDADTRGATGRDAEVDGDALEGGASDVSDALEETSDGGSRVACNYDGRDDGVCVNSYLQEDGGCHEPEAFEETETLCDGKDNDCDGGTDENCPCPYRNKSTGVCGTATVNPKTGDCGKPDDWEADETSCDEKDNDCDGTVDEAGEARTFYRDTDGDGYGVEGDTTLACSVPQGYAEADGDCDADDDSIHPGADEECGDGVDSDCDQTADRDDSDADRWCRRQAKADGCGVVGGSGDTCCYRELFNNRRVCLF